MNRPLILTAATTGNKWRKTDTPYVPLSTAEIVRDAVGAVEAGAAVLHIHARDEQGGQTHDPKYFIPLLDAYRALCPGVVLQLSVGGMEGHTFERLEPLLALRPDYASFNLKGTAEETSYMVELFGRYGVQPIFECFDLAMLETAKSFLKEGLFPGPAVFEVVLDLEDTGAPFGQYAKGLAQFAEAMPEGAVWSVTRGGPHHAAVTALAAGLGGNIRTGLEDSIWYREKTLAVSSAQLVRRGSELARLLGRDIAGTAEARAILGLG